MTMCRMLALCLCVLVSTAAIALAGEGSGDEQVARAGSTSEGEFSAEAVSEGGQTADTREANGEESEAKEMSGMSIVGNDEAPKSLYIVPWKSSEIGVQTSLDTTLNEGDVPVDREVFQRQIEFYLVSTNK